MALYNLDAFERAKRNLERACPKFLKTEDGKNFIKETAMFLAEKELYTKDEINQGSCLGNFDGISQKDREIRQIKRLSDQKTFYGVFPMN